MNYKDYIVFDFETTGVRIGYHEPIQIGAVVVDPRTLEIRQGASFQSLMRPLHPDRADEKALQINGRTLSELAAAPHPKLVWKEFSNFVQQYNVKKSKFTAPIPVGYNSARFDLPIANILCQEYGPWDDKKEEPTLFSHHMLDVIQLAFVWLENNPDVRSLKLDTLRDYFGISKDGAHDALNDAIVTAKILIKYLRFNRHVLTKNKIKLEGAFANEDLSI